MSYNIRYAFSSFVLAIFICTTLHAAELPGKGGKVAKSSEEKYVTVEMRGKVFLPGRSSPVLTLMIRSSFRRPDFTSGSKIPKVPAGKTAMEMTTCIIRSSGRT